MAGRTQRMKALLGSQRFLEGLADGHLQQLAAAARPARFAAGAEIFKEGGSADRLYIIVDGRVELCMTVPARGCIPLLTLEAGDLLGWSAALGPGTMTATALAAVEVEAIRFDAGSLRSLCEQDHTIGYELMRRVAATVSQRLVATRLQALDLFVNPAMIGPGPLTGRI